MGIPGTSITGTATAMSLAPAGLLWPHRQTMASASTVMKSIAAMVVEPTIKSIPKGGTGAAASPRQGDGSISPARVGAAPTAICDRGPMQRGLLCVGAEPPAGRLFPSTIFL